jgi:hypothetical protein
MRVFSTYDSYGGPKGEKKKKNRRSENTSIIMMGSSPFSKVMHPKI